MQAAVPFIWEEWPGKPKPRCSDSKSLEELFSRDGNGSNTSLAPPPGQRHPLSSSGMSTSSSGSEFETGTTSSSSVPSSSSQEQLDRNRSVTLLDLIQRHDSKTLAGLFRSEPPRVQVAKPSPVPQQGMSEGRSPSTRKGRKKNRRSSYLPYKQGIISIFCMSPYTEELVLAHTRNRKSK